MTRKMHEICQMPRLATETPASPSASGTGERHNLAGRMGTWSGAHLRAAVAAWLAFVILAYLLGALVGQRSLTDAEMGSGSSAVGTRLLEQAFPAHAPEQVLVQGRGELRADSPVVSAAVTDLVRRLSSLTTVRDIRTPLGDPRSPLRSRDGRTVLVTFAVTGDTNKAERNVEGALAATRATAKTFPRLRVEELGTASSDKALLAAFGRDFRRAEHTSLPLTLVVLLGACGSLIAAGVPLLLGFTAVIAALGLVAPLSLLLPVAQGQIGPVVLLIGLAVGVDYSMLYLRRATEERRGGLAPDRALARAAATSGEAVLISGLTVLAAMAGMLLAGNAVLTSLAMGTMVVVAIAVVGSLTVLPAVIALLGRAVGWARAPVLARRRPRGPSPGWRAVVARVLRHPARSVAIATGVLLAPAAPALHLRTVDPGTVGLPQNLPIIATYHRIQAAFPGAPLAGAVVVQAPDVTSPPVRSGIADLAAAVGRSDLLAGPVVTTTSADRTIALVTVSLAGNGTNARSVSALARLRNDVLPSTIGRVARARAYVTGFTASSQDFNATMASHLPCVFGFVLGVAFLLLLVTFRSLVVPALTIVLNPLSVAAAYGALVLVFQDGWLRSLIGAQGIGGIVDWIPLFLFVVLLGLSMDCHVRILSRIREGHRRGLPSREAVAEGVTATAGIITSAAVVMIAVFSVFATLSEIIFKELGLALAIAVAVDATVIRLVVLPAAMALLGDRTWCLPRLGRHRGRPAQEPGPQEVTPSRWRTPAGRARAVSRRRGGPGRSRGRRAPRGPQGAGRRRGPRGGRRRPTR